MAARKALTLSIVIPAYNEENHLPACLDAITAQTVQPDEVIVVDNNSSDGTAALASGYPGVRLLTEPKQGVAYARDRGFSAVRSDLIARIDADTILPPDWVKRVHDFYAEPSHHGQALTGGGWFYNVRFGHAAGWWQGQIAFRVNRLLLGHYILFGSNMVIPKPVWRQVAGKVCHNIDIHEDLDLAIHAHRAGVPITYHEDFRVGVKMRRVFSGRRELWANLMWWPQTLRRHRIQTWVFGWLGAALLYLGSFPFMLFRKRA